MSAVHFTLTPKFDFLCADVFAFLLHQCHPFPSVHVRVVRRGNRDLLIDRSQRAHRIRVPALFDALGDAFRDSRVRDVEMELLLRRVRVRGSVAAGYRHHPILLFVEPNDGLRTRSSFQPMDEFLDGFETGIC